MAISCPRVWYARIRYDRPRESEVIAVLEEVAATFVVVGIIFDPTEPTTDGSPTNEASESTPFSILLKYDAHETWTLNVC